MPKINTNPHMKTDIEKVARRIAYLWNLRDRDPWAYSQNRLGVEKEALVSLYPQAIPLARQFFSELERG